MDEFCITIKNLYFFYIAALNWGVQTWVKSYVWFVKPDHRQLQKLHLAGLKEENHSPHSRLGARLGSCNLWRELQSRTQVCLAGHALYILVFLAQWPSSLDLFILGVWQRFSSDSSDHTGGGNGENLKTLFPTLIQYPVVFHSQSFPYPPWLTYSGSIKLQSLLFGSLINEMAPASALIHLTLCQWGYSPSGTEKLVRLDSCLYHCTKWLTLPVLACCFNPLHQHLTAQLALSRHRWAPDMKDQKIL